MLSVNTNYFNLNESYLFSEIARRVAAYQSANHDKRIIKMGIGDVTLPLPAACVEAIKRAAQEMGNEPSFRGYGPEQGYDFLRQAVADYYALRGVGLSQDEIFVSDGAKSDLGNILDLFSADNTVLIPDPVYPVYVDTNVMAGRKIIYLPAVSENNYLPLPPCEDADIIYLCSPNNPTGAVYNREQLARWVEYAHAKNAVILFDAAYEAFIAESSLPRSVYEIEGARDCCIEFCSFSKTAGFTGVRCGYTVVPKALSYGGASLNKLWLRRQTTKFNGVSYIVQRAAAAVFSPEGQRQIKENIEYYRKNAAMIIQTLGELGIACCGGSNSPYIWLKCPEGTDSWEFFDYLLQNANVVATPGEGFGEFGREYIRLTAFSSRENTAEAMERIRRMMENDF